MGVVRCLLLAGMVACGPVGTATADTLEEYEVAGWTIEAFSDDGSPVFTHCTMSADYKGDIDLFFSLGREFHWGLGLVSADWQLKPGERYDVMISIDGGRSLDAVAEAVDPEYAYIAIDGDNGLLGGFRDGRVLRIDAAGDTFKFELDGTSRGLLSLFDCVERHVRETQARDAQARGKANPFAPASQQPSAAATQPDDRGEYRVEAEDVMLDLLSRSGIADYRILPAGEISDSVKQYAVAWQAPAVMGGLFVVPEGERGSAESLLAELAKGHADSCGGKFASNTEASARVKGRYMPRAYAACSDPDGSFVIYYSAFQRRQGGFYITFTGSTAMGGAQANLAAETDDRLREAVYLTQ